MDLCWQPFSPPPPGGTLAQAVGYHLGCCRKLRRAAPAQAQPRSFCKRMRACHALSSGTLTWTQHWRWKAVTPRCVPCPQERQSVGSKRWSGQCEGPGLQSGRLVDVMSQVALGWKVPHWVVKGVLVELGSDPTLAEIKETELASV